MIVGAGCAAVSASFVWGALPEPRAALTQLTQLTHRSEECGLPPPPALANSPKALTNTKGKKPTLFWKRTSNM